MIIILKTLRIDVIIVSAPLFHSHVVEVEAQLVSGSLRPEQLSEHPRFLLQRTSKVQTLPGYSSILVETKNSSKSWK